MFRKLGLKISFLTYHRFSDIGGGSNNQLNLDSIDSSERLKQILN
ncbi:hypothetical protein [Helicobacter sp. 16-1353]|nr:hypothetical protein [Helicobacter sp. 16-1353]